MRRLGVRLLVLGTISLLGCSEDKTTSPGNQPPNLVGIVVNPGSVTLGGVSGVAAFVSDPDQDPLRFRWVATGGSFADSTLASTTWSAPDTAGTFLITLFASDGIDSVSGSEPVIAGNATLTVLSDPPGANIELDGRPTLSVTPHTFTPLAPGTYDVRISSPFWAYERESAVVPLAHGDNITEEFNLEPSMSVPLDLGRVDLLEIGGVSFLAHGSGYVYSGRTAGGTGIFNAALNPQTGGPNGILLLPDVRVEEPLAVAGSPDDEIQNLFFVSAGESLMVASLIDSTADGIVDTVLSVRLLLDQAFGPTVSSTDQVAYSRTPSTDPPGQQLFWSQFDGSGFVGGSQLATSKRGKMPTWQPGGPFIAFVLDGVIYESLIDTLGSLEDTLYAEGYNTAPAWGPRHVAILHGLDEMNITEVRLVPRGPDQFVTVQKGLVDPRYAAWSPVQKAFLVGHHPGGTPQMLLVGSLPIP